MTTWRTPPPHLPGCPDSTHPPADGHLCAVDVATIRQADGGHLLLVAERHYRTATTHRLVAYPVDPDGNRADPIDLTLGAAVMLSEHLARLVEHVQLANHHDGHPEPDALPCRFCDVTMPMRRPAHHDT